MKSLYESIFDDDEQIEDKIAKTLNDIKNELGFGTWLAINDLELSESDIKKIYKELNYKIVDKKPRLKTIFHNTNQTQYRYGIVFKDTWDNEEPIGLTCTFKKHERCTICINTVTYGIATVSNEPISLKSSPTYMKWVDKIEKILKKEGKTKYLNISNEMLYS